MATGFSFITQWIIGSFNTQCNNAILSPDKEDHFIDPKKAQDRTLNPGLSDTFD